MPSSTVKTTVYLDAAAYRRLKALAAVEGRPAAELIRQAVSDFAARHAPGRVPSSVGRGRSNDGSLAERAEELLGGMGEST
ncbi:MAG: ribbon-helix-helix domain-containing protein [Longimicrobiales bacterium]